MARKLVARFDWAREMLAAADQVQVSAGLPSVTETMLCDMERAIDREQISQAKKELARTELAQLAIVTCSAIYARYLSMMGIRPVACGGHSLGELTALYQTGAFDYEMLLQLVSLRGQAMASSQGQTGAMAALLCSREIAAELLKQAPGYAVIANVNSPKQVVVSGDEAAIASIIQSATKSQINAVRLNVSNAFHSNYVLNASQVLRQQAPSPIHPQRFDIDVFSCIDGSAIASDVNLHEYVSRQVVERVDFVSLVSSLEATCDMLIEVGPGNVLSRDLPGAGAQPSLPRAPLCPCPWHAWAPGAASGSRIRQDGTSAQLGRGWR